MVEEPSVEDTISILRGLKERYEVYHGVKHPGPGAHCGSHAVATAISPTVSCRIRPSTWSTRPARSIRTEINSMPAEMDDTSRKIMQLEIEETALKKETDKLSAGAIAAVSRTELADLRDTFNRHESQVGK